MILVTVGTQAPFDRMIKAIDSWAKKTSGRKILAQIGNTNYSPRYIDWCPFLSPEDFKRNVEKADIIISHAGMGTILTSLQYRKPILVMPRQVRYNEQRNDHQLATAKHFSQLGYITVARDEDELQHNLDSIDSVIGKKQIGPHAPDVLLNEVRDFIKMK